MSENAQAVVQAHPYLMVNQIQNYEWGAHDADAYIPQLLGIQAQAEQPYAELWMGAHPKAPSQVIIDGQPMSLHEWIALHPQETLGQTVAERFNNSLPFLFKVLSAGEALSIQAHPNKVQAKVLHARAPQHYPDDNHKPEIAIALDSLTALMGIKPFVQLALTLQRYAELANFIGSDLCERVAQAAAANTTDAATQSLLIREVFTALLTRATLHPHELAQATDQMALRLEGSDVPLDEAERLFITLRARYTGADVGVFALFLLNLVHLKAGEGMYAEAGVPHAYLKGNIIECMANSDNVVRVGLTTKFKDAQALLDILTYTPEPVEILGSDEDADVLPYSTPAPEFRVIRHNLRPGDAQTVQTGAKAEIAIVTEGEVQVAWADGQETYRRGQSFFIPALLREYTLSVLAPAQLFRTTIPI
jgi:mannose-6-phosphate isomerase